MAILEGFTGGRDNGYTGQKMNKLLQYVTDTEELWHQMLSENQHMSYTTAEGVKNAETASCLRDYISRARECKKLLDDKVPVKHTDRIRRSNDNEPGIN